MITLGVWALILRSYGITQQSYWIDESYSITIAQAIWNNGYPLLDSGAVIWRAPVFHYILAGIVGIFGDGYVATRIFSVAVGIATIFLIAYIAKVWFSKSAAVITFVAMTFSYWEIAWSRQARMYMVLQFCFWLALFLFERWRQGKIHWIWPVLLTGITIGIHQLGWLLLGCMALWIVIQRYDRKPLKNLPLVAPYLGVIVGCIGVVILVSYLTTDIGPVQYWTHYSAFLLREHWLMVALSIGGIIMAFLKKQINIPLWLAGNFLLCLGVVSYALPLLQYRYIFFILPILYLMSAYCISVIPKHYLKVLLLGLVLVISPGFTILPQAQYPLESDTLESDFTYKSFTPQPNFSDAYKIIKQYNPDVVITPYPTISRLYSIQDYAVIYVDLTGTISSPPSAEVYTGVSYITINDLARLEAEGNSIIVLVDFFALHRMDPALLTYIEMNGTEVYADTTGAWSSIILHSFNL